MRFLHDREKLTVAVLGLGYVGSCVAATLADGGMDVIGVDTDFSLIEGLRNRHCRFNEPALADLLFRNLRASRLHVTTDYAAVSDADVILITVGTPIRADGSLAEEQLKSACHRLRDHLRAGQLVILKSTVPPGTTRKYVLKALEKNGLVCGEDFGLAFSPERLSEGTALRELRTFPIVVGGYCAESTRAAAAFWHRTLGVEVLPFVSLETAELVKLADNWWIDLNIALANELAQICSRFDVDVLDVITAANTIPKGDGRVNILLPSVGVGGSCLTKDPWMLARTARDRGVTLRTVAVARAVNDAMPRYTAELIVDELRMLGKDPARSKVAVLGLAYKNNTGDLRATPTVPVIALLREAGVEVSAFDPLVDRGEAEKIVGVEPTASLADAVRGADCLAVLAHHRTFEDLDFAALREEVTMPCLVLDGRAYYSKATIAMLRRLGFAYRGIGR